jgi:uncharacterized protein YeaO (DUF488 family)
MEVLLKRAYEEPASTDGFRVLVDRLWPRGKKKADLRLDAWVKDIAPSTELRKWFPTRPEALARILQTLQSGIEEPKAAKENRRHPAVCKETFHHHADLRSEGYEAQ